MRTAATRLFLLLALVAATSAGAQSRDRSLTPDPYKWNLTDLYPSDEAWKQGKQQLLEKIDTIATYRGTLAKSPAKLFGALDLVLGLKKDMYRLYTYANLVSDQDTRVGKYQAMKQEMTQVGSTFAAVASFIEPEILAMNEAKLRGFLKKEPKLAPYKHYLDDLLRRKAHTLSPAEEKVIADATLMFDGPEGIYSIFSNADFPFPQVTLSDGKTVTVDKSSFPLYRTSQNRDDRRKVFDAFFRALGKYRNTFGATLNADVNRDLFSMKARKYATTLESALDKDNIPIAVYMAQLKNTEAALPTFHRYLALRKKILGVDQLHYYDLYAPLLPNVKLEYPIEKAKETIVAAVAKLGPDYQKVIQQSFDSRWIDVYPNDGKRSGAYMSGNAYDVHPYVLTNYNGEYEDLTTMIHELGHLMHSYLANKNQAFVNADAPIFVAEVASTFNEALLLDHLLSTLQDDGIRLALLGNQLENIRLTVFRQTQFADFELKVHQMAEKGEPLTGESLDKAYLEVVKKYYGADKGVTVVDDYVAHEWSYIPHFFYNYYVYQYATSFTASAALSEKVIAGGEADQKRYLDFLSAGGSEYPIELLKTAGVDMTSSEPMELTMKKMNRVMDEMDVVLARLNAKKK